MATSFDALYATRHDDGRLLTPSFTVGERTRLSTQAIRVMLEVRVADV